MPPVNVRLPSNKMANWYYYDKNGYKIGPVRGSQLKAYAAEGTILPETILETEDGRQGQARQINGLTFTDSISSNSSAFVPSPVSAVSLRQTATQPATQVSVPIPAQTSALPMATIFIGSGSGLAVALLVLGAVWAFSGGSIKQSSEFKESLSHLRNAVYGGGFTNCDGESPSQFVTDREIQIVAVDMALITQECKKTGIPLEWLDRVLVEQTVKAKSAGSFIDYLIEFNEENLQYNLKHLGESNYPGEDAYRKKRIKEARKFLTMLYAAKKRVRE